MKYEPSPRPIDCGGISADVNYVDAFTRADDPMHDGAHIHSFCEVYLNLSGDVSFVVEDSVYPVGRGDIIITKPNEVRLSQRLRSRAFLPLAFARRLAARAAGLLF